MNFAQVKGIFYAEFHSIQGPVVVYSVPEGCVTSGKAGSPTSSNPHTILFDAISEYVIPKSSLCNRMVSVSASPSRVIIGHPISIEDVKYERNAFLFNLVFVFDSNARIQPYEQVVRKMAKILRSLENESGFLSNKETKVNVLNIMDQVMQDLNMRFECTIPINDVETINLKLFQHNPPPPEVHDWQVPVQVYQLIKPGKQEKSLAKSLDITIAQVVKFINGTYSLKRISEIADVEMCSARHAIQHLLYYGFIKLVDIFQYSNVYEAVSSNLVAILNNPDLQFDMVEFIRRDENASPIHFTSLFSLLKGFKRGVMVKDWAEENNVKSLNIDIRRLCVFGVIHGFLVRIHKYPILREFRQSELSPNHLDAEESPPMEDLQPVELAKFVKFLDGKHHFDAICTEFDISGTMLEQILSQDPPPRFPTTPQGITENPLKLDQILYAQPVRADGLSFAKSGSTTTAPSASPTSRILSTTPNRQATTKSTLVSAYGEDSIAFPDRKRLKEEFIVHQNPVSNNSTSAITNTINSTGIGSIPAHHQHSGGSESGSAVEQIVAKAVEQSGSESGNPHPTPAQSLVSRSPGTVSEKQPYIQPPAMSNDPSITVVPDHFHYAETSALTILIADMLQRLTVHNDQIPLCSTSLTRFHSRAPPGISILEYLKRIVRYASVERICLLILLVYIDRICEKNKSFTISSLTVHRFIITGVTVACKALCDSFLQNSMYAKVGGIGTKELNVLELEFLKMIEWDLTASAERCQDYYQNLVLQHSGFRMAPHKGMVFSKEILDTSTNYAVNGGNGGDWTGTSQCVEAAELRQQQQQQRQEQQSPHELMDGVSESEVEMIVNA